MRGCRRWGWWMTTCLTASGAPRRARRGGLRRHKRHPLRREVFVIDGAHLVLYSQDAEADREFFRNVLGFDAVDAGHGWLIFSLPPSEAAFHPAASNDRPELYLMCDDLAETMAELSAKGVRCG